MIFENLVAIAVGAWMRRSDLRCSEWRGGSIDWFGGRAVLVTVLRDIEHGVGIWVENLPRLATGISGIGLCV